MRDCGHTVAEIVSREELVIRYFADRHDGLRPSTFERILSTTLP